MSDEGDRNGLKRRKTKYVLCRLVIFCLVHATFRRSQAYDFDVIAHIGP